MVTKIVSGLLENQRTHVLLFKLNENPLSYSVLGISGVNYLLLRKTNKKYEIVGQPASRLGVGGWACPDTTALCIVRAGGIGGAGSASVSPDFENYKRKTFSFKRSVLLPDF